MIPWNLNRSPAVANKALVIRSPDLTLEQKVVALLMCIAQEKKVVIERSLDGAKVQSLLQLNLLHTLSRAPEGTLTVGQLKGLMVDESPNVSRAVSKLTELGLVEKHRSPEDQRTVHVTITRAGERAHVEGDEQLDGFTIGLTKAETRQLFDLLSKL